MHLLNTSTLQLESFADNEVPKYAILSHTWQKEEISFQDMEQVGSNRPSSTSYVIRDKLGYAKIKSACKIAFSQSIDFIWIDTCCIDKTSSAELSEAINSMYQWYQNAVICYTYLSDVPDGENPKTAGSSFWTSRWFTRGWTLQELIAPSIVEFFSQGWLFIGTKYSLKAEISTITGIIVPVLMGEQPPQSMSIATRMFWASNRETTRKEDTSYCLMGLFDVNMPLLYGEGEKAFIRLQEEIMKNSDDHSLFAWKKLKSIQTDELGMLAISPAYFFASQSIVPIRGANPKKTPYNITNRGLRIDLALFRIPGSELFVAPLDCTDSTNCLGPVVIVLRKVSMRDDDKTDQYIRTHSPGLSEYIPGVSPWQSSSTTTRFARQEPRYPFPLMGEETIFILLDVDVHRRRMVQILGLVYSFHIRQTPDSGFYHITDVVPSENWNQETKTLRSMDKSIGIAGTILFAGPKDKRFALTIGVDIQYMVTLRLHVPKKFEQWTEIHDGNERLLNRDVARVYGKKENPEPIEMSSRDIISLARNSSLAFTEITRIEDQDEVVIEATVKQEVVGGEEMYVIDVVTKNDYIV